MAKVSIELEYDQERKIIVDHLVESIKTVKWLRANGGLDRLDKKNLKALKRVLRYMVTPEEYENLDLSTPKDK